MVGRNRHQGFNMPFPEKKSISERKYDMKGIANAKGQGNLQKAGKTEQQKQTRSDEATQKEKVKD